MKLQLKALAAATVASLMVGGVWAESQMGIHSVGTAATAKATLNVTVSIPNIVLLKVGAAGSTQSTAALTVGVTGVSPGASPAFSAFTNTSDVVVDWDGTAAPTLGANTATIPVAAWTNTNNAVVTCASSFTGIAGTDFAVTTSAGAGTLLPHPATASNLNCAGATAILNRNTLYNSNYNYTAGSTLLAALPGSYSGAVTYTITGGI